MDKNRRNLKEVLQTYKIPRQPLFLTLGKGNSRKCLKQILTVLCGNTAKLDCGDLVPLHMSFHCPHLSLCPSVKPLAILKLVNLAYDSSLSLAVCINTRLGLVVLCNLLTIISTNFLPVCQPAYENNGPQPIQIP